MPATFETEGREPSGPVLTFETEGREPSGPVP